jgi:dTDP-4-amino-4,6-dideoxygalactose transaminase
VFVDIDPRTYNIDAELVAAGITPRTRAILPVDQIGLAAAIPAILEIARRHGLPVVEDAAPSLGASIGQGRIGSLSDFTCFSFHPRKSITTAEGGMICTADGAAAERLRVLRSHGASTSDLARHQTAEIAFERYDEPGFNYRLSDVHAAIGIVQMRKLDTIIAARRRLASRYAALLCGIPGLVTPAEPAGYRHTYQSYCVRLPAGVDRGVVMRKLAEGGVSTRRGVMAIHLEPAYRALAGEVSLPATEAAARETLLLPLFPGLADAEQEYVASSLAEALR